MNVLSLFDGISCGMVALEKINKNIERYVVYEIEPSVIKISKNNYPQIEHCGNVIQADFKQFKRFDLLIGGSPCQDLSITQSKTRKSLGGNKSILFWEYVRALNEIQPKWFLFENVASMNEESKNIISEALNCDPVLINSNCFVAQDRPRYYWTNIPVDTDLQECNLCLADILENQVDEKYFYKQDFEFYGWDKKLIARLNLNCHDIGKRVYNPKFKSPTLTAINGGYQEKKIFDVDTGKCRKLTPIEYERLQGLPDDYTKGFANSKRYSGVGNGWTIPVISHILQNIS